MAPPPPRPALGALFLVLAVAFGGIAAAAAEAVDTEPGWSSWSSRPALIGLWLLTLAVRNLRKPPP